MNHQYYQNHREDIQKHITKCNSILEVGCAKGLMGKNISINKYYELVDLFIQKYSKIKPESLNKITDERIGEKFADPSCESKLEESSEKFIKWIMA